NPPAAQASPHRSFPARPRPRRLAGSSAANHFRQRVGHPMNRVYRKIWNQSTGQVVVASELARAKGKGKGARLLQAIVFGGALALAGAPAAHGAPAQPPGKQEQAPKATGHDLVPTSKAPPAATPPGPPATPPGKAQPEHPLAGGDCGSAEATATGAMACGDGAVASGTGSTAVGYAASATHAN